MRRNILIISLILFLGVSASAAPRESSGGGGGGDHSGVQRKQEAKLKTRWTLAEWMDQKKNMKLQDQWLAISTSDNPYEFFLEGERSEQSYIYTDDTNNPEKHLISRGRIGAYASIIGLEGGAETPHKDWSAWDASLNLRLLGTAVQNTNITLEGGAKGYVYTDPTTLQVNRYQNTFAGISLTLYINKFFGLQGEYRKLFFQKSNLGDSLRGENNRALLFIDFSWVRVFGGWTHEYLIFHDELTTRRTQNRDGYFGGLRLFF